MDRNLLTIHKFAEMCRTTPRTIRLYEELGLLTPTKRDNWNKYRMYDPSLGRLFFRIKLLQNFQLTLKEIKQIIKSKSQETFINNRIKTLKEEIEIREKEYQFIKGFKEFFLDDKFVLQSMKKEFLGPFYIFGKLFKEGQYHNITQNLQEISRLCDSLEQPRTSKTLTLYFDQANYKPLKTTLELAVILKKKPQKNVFIPDGYFIRVFPRIEVYSYLYKGPYEFITLVYEKLHELQITQRLPVLYQPLDITFDDFLNPKRSIYELTTKICFPTRK